MNQRTFLKQMGIVSFSVVALLTVIYSFMPFQPDWALGLISWILFAVLTFLMFYFGKQAAASKNRNNFTTLILGITVVKMFLAIAAVFIYHSIAHPESRMFVVPFLLVYFIFTVYETYMLMILSKEKPAVA
ncbi:MAG: hypothetical protein AB8G22_04875 [Saprospiraceae bacterium]